MSLPQNLLPEPPETLLPGVWAADDALAALTPDDDPAAVAARFPAYSAVWAVLADRAYAQGHVITSYAFARTGYHRGLDALRRNGWKGHGPVPWSHAPNQGFLRCLAALARAAGAIGEADEASRCWAFLRDSSAEAYEELKA